MKRFWGIGAALAGALTIIRNPSAFLKVALVWSIVHTAALLSYPIFEWLRGPLALDIGGNMFVLRQADEFVVNYALTVIPDLLASLTVAIWWTRFALFGTLPNRWIGIPRGSARLFSFELILIMAAVTSAVPGLVLTRIAYDLLDQPLKNIVAFAVAVLDVALVIYGCMRFWLIFPAIAVGDDHIRFRESLKLTKKAGVGLLLGFAVAYLIFDMPSILLTEIQDRLPLYGRVADAIAIVASILVSLLVLAGTATAAAVTAALYRERVLLRPAVS